MNPEKAAAGMKSEHTTANHFNEGDQKVIFSRQGGCQERKGCGEKNCVNFKLQSAETKNEGNYGRAAALACLFPFAFFSDEKKGD